MSSKLFYQPRWLHFVWGVPTWSYRASRPWRSKLYLPLCNTDTFYHLYSWILRSTAVLFLFIINMRSTFRGGEGNHTYSLVGQSTDKIKLHRRLLCCIHDRLAFDDVAACRSCGSYWRQLTASLPAAIANTCCQIHACALPLSARRGCGLSAPALRSWLTVCQYWWTWYYCLHIFYNVHNHFCL